MLYLLFPRFQRHRKIPEVKFEELQHELELRVDRLEAAKTDLVAHANGALAPHGAAPWTEANGSWTELQKKEE